MGIIELIVSLIKLALLYFGHKWDPETLKKEEEKLKEEKNEEIRKMFDDAISNRAPLSLSALLNARYREFVNSGVLRKESDSGSTGGGRDLLGSKLPEQQGPERDLDIPGDKPGGLEAPK